jgi:uncharacterized membrane protein
MKRLFLIGFVVFAFSCTYDNAEELYGIKECPPDGVSFSDTIKPIIESNCAVPGCHANGGQQPTFETYEQIAANADIIKIRTSNGTMPPASSGNSLTQEEIDKIFCWVVAGAPNN